MICRDHITQTRIISIISTLNGRVRTRLRRRRQMVRRCRCTTEPRPLAQILQANRDPKLNWEVDIARSLEDYLLKICSGEVSGEDGAHSVNFAEAALLLQGSVQVYSRKVEYLYSLVLHALEFLSQKKQHQLENGSPQANQDDPSMIDSEEDDIFMGLDDVPAESRTSLGNNANRDRKIVRPPANLLVFEGDYLYSEASELDTYLLATCDFYEDFLLLDPSDAPAVFDFLQGKHCGGLDPTQENPNQSSTQATTPDDNHCSDPVEPSFADDAEMPHPHDIEDPVGDYSDDKDPWKPLNPLEPGNLKIRPYRRVQGSSRVVNDTSKKKSLTILFPMAKMDGVIITEHAKSFEAQPSQQEEHCGSQSPPRFEKNALLASIAEVEKQSEMDARVSTWKERIEDILEEQDKNPPFDIASYEEQILGTLSSRTDNTGTASFSEIVSCRPKYEVARTFFALLRLVNGESVGLDKGQATKSVCYTAENPFHVRLISPNRRPEMEARFARKRVKSPLQNAGQGGESSLAQHECPKKPLHRNGKIPDSDQAD